MEVEFWRIKEIVWQGKWRFILICMDQFEHWSMQLSCGNLKPYCHGQPSFSCIKLRLEFA